MKNEKKIKSINIKIDFNYENNKFYSFHKLGFIYNNNNIEYNNNKFQTLKKEKKIINKKAKYLNYITLFYILIMLLINIPLTNETKSNLRNLLFVSEITLTILGKGDQYILSNKSTIIDNKEYSFNYIPDQILINGILQNFTGNMVYNLEKDENIINIKFNNLLEDCNLMFYDMNNIIKIDLSKFDSSKVTEMIGMFSNCRSLISLNLDNFRTSLVTNMHSMFQGCEKLTSLNLDYFNTSSVINMHAIFSSCKSLISLNLKNFNTSSVTIMAVMFLNCNSLKSLDLSHFNTKSVVNFHGLFKNCSSLISLNIDNFDTSLVTNMNDMFIGCSSLISLNLINFSTSSMQNLYNMFNYANMDIIYCLDQNNIPKIVEQIKELNKNYKNNCSDICFTNHNNKIIFKKNLCISDCKNDDIYRFEYNNLCYESCPNNTHISLNNEYLCEIDIFENETNAQTIETNNITNFDTNEGVFPNKSGLLPNWDIDSFFNGDIEINTKNSSIKDKIISSISSDIIKGKINLTNLVKGDKKDLLVKKNDTIFQITSTENQNNNDYEDISSIQLGECEKILKQKYNISKDLPLIIFKIDYFIPEVLIPVIGYEIFHPINKSKLDLNYCKDAIVNFNIPVNIREDELFKYNPNSEYYTDDCSPYTTENGTDILINDRQFEYNSNNMSLCEKNCSFSEYDENKKKVNCNCGIKSRDLAISEIINDENILSTFSLSNNSESSNILTMKCVYTLFTKEGIIYNIDNYILLIIIIIFLLLLILFYKVGYEFLMNDIEKILELEKKKRKKSNNIYNFNNINNYNTNKINNMDINYNIKNHKKIAKKIKNTKSQKLLVRGNSKKKTKESQDKINHTEIINNDLYPRKSKKDLSTIKKIKVIKKIKIKKKKKEFNNQTNKISIYSNIKSSKLDLMHTIKKEKDKIIDNIDIHKDIKNHEIYTDYELNTFSYEKALLYDKREYFQYYIYLIRTKQPLIFAFVPIKDYNSIIIKISLFLLLFTITYVVDALFFTETAIHKIYEDKGIYNISYFLPKIFFSFIINSFIFI